MITRIQLIRHGSTVTFDPDLFDGNLCRQDDTTPISHLGKTQAEQIAKALSMVGVDVLFSSQYLRAIETAEKIIEFLPHLFINTDKRVNELTRVVDGEEVYGDLNLLYRQWRGEMLKTANIHAKFDPRDQSFYEKLSEFLEFLEMAVKECAGQKIAIIGHSQVFALFLAYVDIKNNRNETPAGLVEAFNKRFMDNGAITTVEYDDRKRKWSIVRFNDTRHLP